MPENRGLWGYFGLALITVGFGTLLSYAETLSLQRRPFMWNGLSFAFLGCAIIGLVIFASVAVRLALILGDRKTLGGILVEGNILLSEIHVFTPFTAQQDLLDWDGRLEMWRARVQAFLARRMPAVAGYFGMRGDQPSSADMFPTIVAAQRGELHVRETSLATELRRLGELVMKI
jgi:hypothetical protein